MMPLALKAADWGYNWTTKPRLNELRQLTSERVGRRRGEFDHAVYLVTSRLASRSKHFHLAE